MNKFVWLLLGVGAVQSFGDETVFHCKVGDFDVYMLVETSGPGRSNILIGADQALISKYIKSDSRSAICAFLIRGGGKTVLVDTALGGAIFDSLKKLSVDPAAVDAVLITHLHGDHFGGLAKNGKAMFPKADVYLAEQEKDYWTKTSVNKAAVDALAPYGSRVKTFRPAGLDAALAEILPGISPVAAFGHTPGHTCYLVQSGGARLLLWGDLMHVQDIQFPRPDISVTYDTDPVMAAESRKKVLDYAVKNKVLIGGMHLVYPAIGSVSADGAGYKLSPAK